MPPKTATIYKIGVLGDGGVGKTATVTQFVCSYFTTTYDPTLEDGYRKQCTIDNETCMLELLDTAGQEEYTALRDQWIRDSEGLLLMYSITSRSSFEKTRALYQQIQRLKREAWERQKNQSYGTNAQRVPDRNVFRDGKFRGIMLAGNKIDVGPEQRVVSTREGKALADELGVDFMECSAKTRVNIDETIHGLVRRIRDEWEDIQFLESGGYKVGGPKRNSSGRTEVGVERKKSGGGFWKKLVSSKSMKK